MQMGGKPKDIWYDPGFIPDPRQMLAWVMSVHQNEGKASMKDRKSGFSVADEAAKKYANCK